MSITILLHTTSSCSSHTCFLFVLLLSQILRYLFNCHSIHCHSSWAQLWMFCLFCPLTHLLSDVCLCFTEEKRTAQRVRQRLWELLAPAGLTEDSGASPWLHAYRQLLQEEGADEEMQRRAVLMQLWATQVSLRSGRRAYSMHKGSIIEIRQVTCLIRLTWCRCSTCSQRDFSSEI